MKAIILSRVSTNEQQEGHSIDAQKARLRENTAKERVFRLSKNLRSLKAQLEAIGKIFTKCWNLLRTRPKSFFTEQATTSQTLIQPLQGTSKTPCQIPF